MRVRALQVCPELTYALATPTFTARGRSASGRTTLGDLPPSSAATRLPARVEPVNETMSTPSCDAIASPTTGPGPDTRLNTPDGNPASSMMSASAYAASGATSLGLSTTVQPAARAGATLATTWW